MLMQLKKKKKEKKYLVLEGMGGNFAQICYMSCCDESTWEQDRK